MNSTKNGLRVSRVLQAESRLQELCQLLDDGGYWKKFAAEIETRPERVTQLQNLSNHDGAFSPSRVLLGEWQRKKEATLSRFLEILQTIDNHDAHELVYSWTMKEEDNNNNTAVSPVMKRTDDSRLKKLHIATTIVWVLIVLGLCCYVFDIFALCQSCQSKPGLQQMWNDAVKQLGDCMEASKLLADHKSECEKLACTVTTRSEARYFCEICNPEYLLDLHPLISQLASGLERSQSWVQLPCERSNMLEFGDYDTRDKFIEMINLVGDLSGRVAAKVTTLNRKERELKEELTECMKCPGARSFFL